MAAPIYDALRSKVLTTVHFIMHHSILLIFGGSVQRNLLIMIIRNSKVVVLETGEK